MNADHNNWPPVSPNSLGSNTTHYAARTGLRPHPALSLAACRMFSIILMMSEVSAGTFRAPTAVVFFAMTSRLLVCLIPFPPDPGGSYSDRDKTGHCCSGDDAVDPASNRGVGIVKGVHLTAPCRQNVGGFGGAVEDPAIIEVQSRLPRIAAASPLTYGIDRVYSRDKHIVTWYERRWLATLVWTK
ncbi:hypothetical protein ASPBRDRAFT_660895 [Aspergillus brasiliensis CBS 101740]|uniref:Uncharacterized protein n=1 Tax=Aspergillus brasiliensis (strain CBS 101740 / IMI 381727 / IBT 21946) TaxID=767769 RepID=A0A1L9U7F4_ASPBC|nr:hypothetical protein ASPBRDRAFT_660895 [Aspergillus brasiliensis CBS 101740]